MTSKKWFRQHKLTLIGGHWSNIWSNDRVVICVKRKNWPNEWRMGRLLQISILWMRCGSLRYVFDARDSPIANDGPKWQKHASYFANYIVGRCGLCLLYFISLLLLRVFIFFGAFHVVIICGQYNVTFTCRFWRMMKPHAYTTSKPSSMFALTAKLMY